MQTLDSVSRRAISVTRRSLAICQGSAAGGQRGGAEADEIRDGCPLMGTLHRHCALIAEQQNALAAILASQRELFPLLGQAGIG